MQVSSFAFFLLFSLSDLDLGANSGMLIMGGSYVLDGVVWG